MSGRGWLAWVRSNDKLIIDALQNQAANLLQATEMLLELVTNYNDVDKKRSKIKDLEHEGDVIAHKLFNIMDETFVTPFDREDISRIASSIDEILDYTDGTADRLVLFKIQRPTTYMIELANILLSASQEVYFLMTRLRRLKNTQELIEHCNNISKYEHQADSVYMSAIAELFEVEANPIEIIKLKEVYETLEGAQDRCADVADVIEDITLKYG
jgi:predicted phosphate transport protein (TIGR00153 family)